MNCAVYRIVHQYEKIQLKTNSEIQELQEHIMKHAEHKHGNIYYFHNQDRYVIVVSILSVLEYSIP